MASSLFLGAAFLLTAFAPNVQFLFFSVGIVAGTVILCQAFGLNYLNFPQ